MAIVIAVDGGQARENLFRQLAGQAPMPKRAKIVTLLVKPPTWLRVLSLYA